MSVDIKVVSDVHCDTRPQWEDAWKHDLVNVVGRDGSQDRSILILAGDVGPYAHPKYRDYLNAITSKFRSTVYIPGNHEFYEAPGSVYQTCEYIDRVCATLDSNVTCLHTGSSIQYYDVPMTNARIVGATMWTNVPDMFWPLAQGLLNDYNYIPGTTPETGKLNTIDVNGMHRMDRMWVAQGIQGGQREDKDIIVVTHHSPERRLSLYNDSRTAQGLGPLYFASDMDDIMSMDGICAWIFGHTHESHCIKLPEYRYNFITNAYGYPTEKTGFSISSGFKLKKV